MEYNNNEQKNTLPKLSHQTEGENFLEFQVGVERLSKTQDLIPVMVSERSIIDGGINIGDKLLLKGQYRSHNKSTEFKSKLLLHFFAKDIYRATDEQINEVKLTGFICKTPIYRKTPFDREICDVLLAVNRAKYHRSDYIPCILWGRNARFVSTLPVGSKLTLEGRIQSRIYTKTLDSGETEERTAYEVSCHKVVQQEDQQDAAL